MQFYSSTGARPENAADELLRLPDSVAPTLGGHTLPEDLWLSATVTGVGRPSSGTCWAPRVEVWPSTSTAAGAARAAARAGYSTDEWQLGTLYAGLGRGCGHPIVYLDSCGTRSQARYNGVAAPCLAGQLGARRALITGLNAVGDVVEALQHVVAGLPYMAVRLTWLAGTLWQGSWH